MNDIVQTLRAEIVKMVDNAVRALVHPDPTGTVIDFDDAGDPLIRLDGDFSEVSYPMIDSSLPALQAGDKVLLHRAGGRLLVAHVWSAS